ncbi:PAS domain-containing sensor histidine kinase [Candidatus Methanoperedens nitratireducens]|uniref:histidine kinase n=1 Tax=Candidatus Methanoperedens nitratireducens TaxID=1392998 RepID=A0A284VTC0_9EURY|nr:PAS domain-containing sensor histidine kinase [Candidatus Methanoperedens nitroreducens]SNQ62512.1 putative Histidine kinase [Candidatus Methanoperedens nitroreducens]
MGTIFENIFEFAPDAIVVVNREGHIVRVNTATEKMFGYTRDELLGKTVEILVPERFRERHVEQRNGYFIKPRVRSLGLGMGLYGRRKDGNEFPADIMLSPLETAGGMLVLSVVRDITERRQAEEELRRAHDELEIRVQERTSELAKANEALQDEIAERRRAEEALKNYTAALEEANRIKDLFTDIMHHDLLNPLSIIKTMSELQLEKTEEDGIRRSLLMIKRNADKLIGMIKSASKYARLESAEKLERSKLDLNMVFRAAADSLMPQIEEKNMKLEYLAKDECYAMVNPIIEDVFSNLLDNAIKYSPAGSKIEVNIIDGNNSYRIYVKDWGPGIKDEDKVKLFTRFQRVDKKGVKGTGLGLAIVKRIVNLHGGDVWIEDNPEGGSVFFVKIPKT